MGEIPHKIIYLCPKYVNEETPEAWREWLLAIDDSLDGQVDETHYHNACVQKVLDTIEQDSVTPSEYARMKDEYSEEQLRLKEWEEAIQKSKQLGLEEGLERGLEKGKELGLEEGLERGKELGLEEGKRETARRMLAKGMAVSLVADLTGLDVASVQGLVE